jgi:hypothetical protein
VGFADTIACRCINVKDTGSIVTQVAAEASGGSTNGITSCCWYASVLVRYMATLGVGILYGSDVGRAFLCESLWLVADSNREL